MINNILIVDDSKYKRDNIIRYMKDIFPNAKISTYDAVSPLLMYVLNTRNKIKENPCEWLIITDMVMPRYSDEGVIRTGGIVVISRLARWGISCPVILQSGDKIDQGSIESIKPSYSNLLGTVLEDSSVDNTEVYRQLLMKYDSV